MGSWNEQYWSGAFAKGLTEWPVFILGIAAIDKSHYNINMAVYVLLKEDVDFSMMVFMVTCVLRKCWEMALHDILCTLI